MNIIELIDVYTSNFVKEQGTLLLSYTLITIIYYLVEVVGISYIVNNLKDKKTYKRLKKVSLVILLCVAIFFYIKGMVENKLSSALSLNSRQKLFTSIIDRYKESYKDIKIGGVVTRIYNITYDFRLAILNFLKYIFPTMLVLLISVALIFRVDKKVGYLLAACLFTTCIICYYGYLNIRESKRLLENSFYRNIDSLVNKYQNLLNSYINNETVHDKNRVTTQQANYSKDILRSENDNVINTSLLRANLCVFFFLIILCVCKNKESQKSIGYVSVILLYFVTNYLNFSITSSTFFEHIGIVFGSANFCKDLLYSNRDASITKINSGAIVAENVNFSYKKNSPVLKDFNVNIRDKEKVAILGSSGSGKSTFAKLLLKLHNYTGKIYLDNKNIQKIHTDTLRKNIVYINQKTTLLDGTVIKNMMYGNRQSQSHIVDLLKKYDLLSIFSGLKKGVYERVLMSGTNLSLGMQKVIILVRGILKAHDSKIIFFDEPLAGLDQISRTKVIKMILNECVDNTIIIITHDKEIIPYMDKVYNMNEINKL